MLGRHQSGDLVERPARGIARALADAPQSWSPPPSLAEPLRQLLSGVAEEVDGWTDAGHQPRSGAASPVTGPR